MDLQWRTKLEPHVPFVDANRNITVTLAQNVRYNGKENVVMRYANMSLAEWMERGTEMLAKDRHLYVVSSSRMRIPYMDLDNVAEDQVPELRKQFMAEFSCTLIYEAESSKPEPGKCRLHWRGNGPPVDRMDLEAFAMKCKLRGIHGVDTAPYSIRQCFRLPNQSKLGKNHPVKEIGPKCPLSMLLLDCPVQPITPVPRREERSETTPGTTQVKRSQPKPAYGRGIFHNPFEKWPFACPIAGRKHKSSCTYFARAVGYETRVCVVFCHHSSCVGRGLVKNVLYPE